MMLPETQQTMVSLGLLGLGVYFTVQLVRGLLGYRGYLRVKPTAVATWPAPRQALNRWLVALGAFGGVVALLNAWLQRPPHHVYGLAVMSAYFVVMVPLATTIRLGVYRDGISDLVLGDRKVGGACIYRTRGLLFYSASLLVAPILGRYLDAPVD
mgnify:CR=1 FL=1